MNQPSQLFPRTRCTLAEGAVHVPDWLAIDEQRHLVDACRQWAKPPAPMRATRLPNGGVMSVKSVCLGWHWVPYRYTRFAEDTDGAPVDPFPDWLAELGQRAVSAAYENPADGSAYEPDAALINFYDGDARLGLHQDQEERANSPVVSISLGDSAIFRFGNTRTRGRPYRDIELHSGDLVVFGGPSRYAYHGVPKILPGTGPAAIGLTRGRLNVTLRVTGLGR
jgi:alkylated DNA repair protein (DNA oxidative demethylase)